MPPLEKLDAVDEVATTADGEPQCHISRYVDEGYTYVEMFCGLHIAIEDDGETVPPGVDFVAPIGAYQADCEPCRRAFLDSTGE